MASATANAGKGHRPSKPLPAGRGGAGRIARFIVCLVHQRDHGHGRDTNPTRSFLGEKVVNVVDRRVPVRIPAASVTVCPK